MGYTSMLIDFTPFIMPYEKNITNVFSDYTANRTIGLYPCSTFYGGKRHLISSISDYLNLLCMIQNPDNEVKKGIFPQKCLIK